MRAFRISSTARWLLVAGLCFILPRHVCAETDAGDGTLLRRVLVESVAEAEIYDVSYASQGLRISGKLIVPMTRTEPLPLLVFSHGGISGIGQRLVDRAVLFANDGYAVMASSYRGEDGSDGEVEVAHGEVDDVLNAMKAATGMPFIDEDRVGWIGTSHGALINLLACQRTQRARCLIFAYGVANIYSWQNYLNPTGIDAKSVSENDSLSWRLYGLGPHDQWKNFQDRFGLMGVERIPCPVLVIQGGEDKIVPVFQAEELCYALEREGKSVQFYLEPQGDHGFDYRLDPDKYDRATVDRARKAHDAILQFLAANMK